MNMIKVSTPFYTRLAMILVSLIAVGYLCILGKELLCPLVFSLLLSLVLLPLGRLLEKKARLPRSAASGIAVIIFVVLVFLLLYLVGSQITGLARDWPMFREQLMLSLHQLQEWISASLHVNIDQQMLYVKNATSKVLTASTAMLGTTVLTVSSIMLFLVFTMIDTFFLLFYRRLIMKFLVAAFKEENATTVYEISSKVQLIIRKYIIGLLLEMTIVSAVCCLAFWLIGIKYAVLLGLLTGLFNIIPYIGIFTALLLNILITFATGAVTTKIILVLATVIGMHLVDSNILLPLIVGSKVRINALITVMAVIIGEMIWGISGMFLAIPVVAIAKIIFDKVDSLQPWGILLGDEKDEKEPAKFLTRIRPVKKQVAGTVKK